MKQSTIVLLVFGLILEFSGFALGYPEKFPFVTRILSPSYIHASQELKAFTKSGFISQGKHPFPEISKIIKNLLRKNYPKDKVNKIEIKKMTYVGSSSKYTTGGEIYITKINILLSDNSEVPWTLEALRKEINKMKADSFFGFGIALFVCGALLQFAGLIIEYKQKNL